MIIYIDMDDVMCDFSEAHKKALDHNPGVKYPQGIEGFFLKLSPIHGAIDSVELLRQNFDVYILTAPSTRNPHCYSEKRIWIEDHFGYEFTKKLIISPNKGLLRGDILIDDHIDGKGQEEFEGDLIHFGSTSFPDWSSVMEHLTELTSRYT